MRGWWRLRFTKEVPFWFWNCAFASDSFPYQKGVFAPFTSSSVIVNERSGLSQQRSYPACSRGPLPELAGVSSSGSKQAGVFTHSYVIWREIGRGWNSYTTCLPPADHATSSPSNSSLSPLKRSGTRPSRRKTAATTVWGKAPQWLQEADDGAQQQDSRHE